MFLSSFVAVGLDDESCGRVIPFQTPGSSMDAIAVPAATRLHHKRHHNGVNTVARDGGGEGIETPRSSDRSIQAVERSSTTVWKSDPVSSHRPQAVQGTKPTLEGNGARDSCPVSSSVTVDRSKETSARKTTHRRVGRCTAPAELLGKETHVGHTHWKKLSKKTDGFELEHLGNVLGSEPRRTHRGRSCDESASSATKGGRSGGRSEGTEDGNAEMDQQTRRSALVDRHGTRSTNNKIKLIHVLESVRRSTTLRCTSETQRQLGKGMRSFTRHGKIQVSDAFQVFPHDQEKNQIQARFALGGNVLIGQVCLFPTYPREK